MKTALCSTAERRFKFGRIYNDEARHHHWGTRWHGPEVSVKAAWKSTAPIILVGDREMLLRQAVQLGLSAEPPANISFEHVPLGTTVHAGVLDVRNSPYVLETLRRAHQICVSSTDAAVVTAPVQKSILSDAGEAFTGHTEFF